MLAFMKRIIRYALRKIRGLKSRLLRKLRSILKTCDYRRGRHIFVFGAPFHSNAGDQAQTYCIEKWIKKSYPNYKIHIFDSVTLTNDDFRELRLIRRCIKKEDKIFLHSGYHTTDLYLLEENMQRKTIELFPDHPIVVLPQTVFYQNDAEKEKAIKIYNSHPNLLLFCRDEVSFSLAEELFPNCRRILFPDIVTTEIGQHEYRGKREGILLCLRNDKESALGEGLRSSLLDRISAIDRVEITDTTLPMSGKDFIQNRSQVLLREWEKYSHYRVIITDRYHGTIFSLIANTPVIVMPSTDHKLKSGVNWFPKEFAGYIYYAETIDEIPAILKTIYQAKLSYQLPAYFQEKYYSRLKNIIEGDADADM